MIYMSASANLLRLRQEPREQLHDLNNEIVQLCERWDKRLKLPLAELPERYHRNNLGVVLQLLMPFGLGEYSALITQDVLLNDFWWNCDTSASNAQDKLPVFVRNIHAVKSIKGVFERLGGVIRLKPIDHIADGGVRDSLYFSFVTGKTVFVPWPRFEDGEFDEVPTLPCPIFEGRKVPCNVVQTRAQVVDNFTDQDAKSQRDALLFKVLDCLQKKLHVLLGENWIAAFLEELVDLDLKIADVLLGPF
jgi:hypothetical protein